jgi:hypothetical protein
MKLTISVASPAPTFLFGTGRLAGLGSFILADMANNRSFIFDLTLNCRKSGPDPAYRQGRLSISFSYYPSVHNPSTALRVHIIAPKVYLGN